MEAYSKPHYISLAFTEDKRIDEDEISDDVIKDLEKLDPLRRAFELADWADQMHSTNLKSNYDEIKDKLDGFTRGVLTQCHNMDEVETILEHQPQPENPEDRPKPQNLMKALWEGRVEFVSHPYYQAYFNKRLTGNATETLHPVLWHLIHMPLALLLFTCYPLVVFLDFFRKADILFSTNEEKVQSETSGAEKCETDVESRRSRFFTFFRARIHTPVYRQIVHCTIQFIYLVLLVVMVWNPIEHQTDDPEPHLYHYIVVVITGLFLLEDGTDFYMNLWEKEKANFFESYWNIFSLLFRSILFIGLVVYLPLFDTREIKTSRATESGDDELNWSFTLISVGVAGEFFKTLRFLLFFPSLGPLVICIINVMKDVLKMVVVFCIVFSTYGILMWAMFKPFQGNQQTGNYTTTEKVNTGEKLFHTLFWRLLNAADEGPVSITRLTKTDDGKAYEVSYEFSHAVTMFVWAAYQIVIAIVLVNLLIAMMCNTFGWLNVV